MSHEGRRAHVAHAEASRRRVWAWIGAAALLVAAAAVLVSLRPVPAAPLDAAQDPVLGSAGAPITAYYFGDFQCPACRQFESGNLQALVDHDVAAGSLRIVFKDFPFIGDDSWTAAEASQFVWANAPADYWAWHHGLYGRQGAERSGWASADNLVAYSAGFPSIDADALRAALADHRYRAEAEADHRAGVDHGVSSTPSLVIGSRVVSGNDAAGVRAALEAAK